MDFAPPSASAVASFPHVLFGSIPPALPPIPNPILDVSTAPGLHGLSCPISPIRALAAALDWPFLALNPVLAASQLS